MEEIEICPPRADDYPIARNLAQFYVYDMSEHAGWDFPDDGLFATGDSLMNYWGMRPADQAWPAHWRGYAHLLRAGGHPAGFALVRQVDDGFLDMGEFFIVRKYRRRGAGARVAKTLFARHTGRWQVRELLTNKGAQAFWRHVIGDFTGGAYTEAQEHFAKFYGDREFVVQRFDSAKR